MKQIAVMSESDKCLWGKKWCIANYEAKKSKSAGKYENPETIQLKLTASEYIKLKPKQCNSC